MKRYIIIITVLFLFVACDSSIFSGKLKEGTIEYKLEYLDDANEKPIISLLPTEMKIQFKKAYYLQSVEGWMGVFRMAGVNNVNAKKKSALLKMMNKKYLYQVDGNSEGFGFNPMKDKKIEYTEEIKEIAGYKCKKANITWNDYKFAIYYTDKIKIDEPNWNNPFPEIKGVLLEYQYEMFNIKTKVTAISVIKEDIEDEIFEIPADYKNVSKKEMEDVINDLM